MKKIVLWIILLLTLTSCFWWKEELDNKIEVKKNNIEKIEVNSNSWTVIEEKIDNNKTQDNFSEYDKSFKKETENFIEKLNENPDILREVICGDFKDEQTKKYCDIKKKEYLNIMWEIEKNIETKESHIVKTSINEVELTEEQKKNSTEITIDKLENIEEINKEIDALIKEYNNNSSIIESKDCEIFKYKWTIDLCNTMKKDYTKFTQIPEDWNAIDSWNNKNINDFMKKVSTNPDFLKTVDCKKEKGDVIELCLNIKKNNIPLEPVTESINSFFEKIDKNEKILETIDCKKEDIEVVETCNNVKKDYIKNNIN